MDTEGILAGCDRHQEWILPWWWQHYTIHNTHPVAFVDLGMSEQGISWCKQKGIYIKLDPPIHMDLIEDQAKKKQWEDLFGPGIWKARPIWLQKPFACLKSPFERTIWIDLDCRVSGDLTPLFNLLRFPVDIVIAKDKEAGILQTGEWCYNSGVIGFIKNAKIIDVWCALTRECSPEFPGDQESLSRAIFLLNPPFLDLPESYNLSWKRTNPSAVITHFHGINGKLEIFKWVQAQSSG